MVSRPKHTNARLSTNKYKLLEGDCQEIFDKLFLHAADGQVIVSAWLVVSREAVIEAQEQEFLCAIIAIYPVEGREVGVASCRRFIVPEGYKRRPINIAGESGTMFADFRHELSQVRGFFISGKVFVFRSVERVEIRGIGQSPASRACR